MKKKRTKPPVEVDPWELLFTTLAELNDVKAELASLRACTVIGRKRSGFLQGLSKHHYYRDRKILNLTLKIHELLRV